jgi:hypothetical protein
VNTRNGKQSLKQVLKDPVILWVLLSFFGILVSYAWTQIDPENYFPDVLNFCSWLSSLLAVGYMSTPSGSWHGKLAFIGTVVIVIGITFKVLHLPGGNELILSGLAGTGVAYVFLWRKRKQTTDDNATETTTQQ